MSTFYPITKIRLVNFHNVGTTTLELPGGGHLFLLGVNGSGKTTVLDAVHFVLDPGRSMEFNSAARVAGAKNAGGRTIQGIVMRYNIETHGPMNPNGGVTYAALEIEGRHGKPVSIAVGVSTRSMDERYESWGVITEAPVDTLPLCRRDGDRLRPATKSELREALGGKGFYAQIGRYTDELATRFFDNRETYRDVCQLLSTGKAYREIASRAGDYDKLFRELLQEPQKEIFEDLVRDLKTLEESRLALDGLRQRVAFVREIVALRDEIRQRRITAAATQWQASRLEIDDLNAVLARLKEEKVCEEGRREALQIDRERIANDAERARNRLTELRMRDSQGLVAQEHAARIEWERRKLAFSQACSRMVQVQRSVTEKENELTAATEALVRRVRRGTAELQRFGTRLPFSTATLAGAYDEACRESCPEDALSNLTEMGELTELADRTASETSRKLQAIEDRLETLENEGKRLEKRIETLQKQDEALPRIEGFAEAREVVRDALLDAFPLYEGLEPVNTLRPPEIAMLEQLIGDAVLGTWIVPAENADALRKLLFKKFPAHSLAVIDEDDETRCDWLPQFFDMARSNPDAVTVLRKQLTSRLGPTAHTFLENRILAFRGREQPVRQEKPRLIGVNARQEFLQREINEAEKALAECHRERRFCLREKERLADLDGNLQALRKSLRELNHVLTQLGFELKNRRNLYLAERLQLENAETDRLRCEEDEQFAHEKHEDVILKMRQSGLDADLEEKLRTLEKKIRTLERHLADCDRETGAIGNRITKIQEQSVLLADTLAKRLEERSRHEAAVLQWAAAPEGDLEGFILAHCQTDTTDRDRLRQKGAEAEKASVQFAERIRGQLISNAGLPFGFVYEEETNALTDRRGADLDTVLAECSRQLEEQESIINADTVRVFKEIVMDKLIRSLCESVARLNEMSHKVGRLLRNRSFGQNKYAFSITAIPEYAPLINIVRSYHALDSESTETELMAFLEGHKDDILATGVGEIPPLLDYRNWFRYELKIMTADEEGKTIDRKVKGLGSGGEQAVPNYLLILTIANFLYDRERIHLPVLVFDEAFYGIDARRRDQLLAFANDLGLQLFVASPDQDGVKKEIPRSTSVLVIKDSHYDVHLYPCHWNNTLRQDDLLAPEPTVLKPEFGPETT
ncbi:MAG: AAA family ATPase [Kiritimatiellae bacterium]|nr:AAA family ATPase [Kiritimatiellia bacterium]